MLKQKKKHFYQTIYSFYPQAKQKKKIFLSTLICMYVSMYISLKYIHLYATLYYILYRRLYLFLSFKLFKCIDNKFSFVVVIVTQNTYLLRYTIYHLHIHI